MSHCESIVPFFLEQDTKVTRNATNSGNESTTVESLGQATKAAQDSTNFAWTSPESTSRERVAPCTEFLDFFRLLPAEKEFLLGEIKSRTAMDLHSPSPALEPDGEDEDIDYISIESHEVELLSPKTPSDDTSQEDASIHAAFPDHSLDNFIDQPEAEVEKEDYHAYGADFVSLCDLFVGESWAQKG